MVEIRRRTLLSAAGGLVFLAVPTSGRPAAASARVGWLGWTGGTDTSPSALALPAFRAGLADRGWKDGGNLVIEVRAGDGSRARDLATELLAARVDLIVAQGPMVFGARNVVRSVPLIFNINGDPVEAGLVTNLARPEANITGVTSLSAELAGKRLQLIKEALPGVVRVAAIANQSHPGVQTEYQASHAAARQLGLELQWVAVHGRKDFDAAFASIEGAGASAVVAIPDNLVNAEATRIASFATPRRLPTISGWAEFAEAGNLMSYGPDVQAYYRRVARYADKLLRGARPADLPVELPTEFELVLNLRAAQALGLTVPRSILLRANSTIR